jgi:hypothetical protein
MADLAACVACGLFVDDEGNLNVETDGVWPYACDESNGGGIYCGSDRVLRVAPAPSIPLVQSVGGAANLGIDLEAGQARAGNYEFANSNNPSDCLSMVVIVDWEFEMSVSMATGSAFALYAGYGNLTDAILQRVALYRNPGGAISGAGTSWTLRRRDVFVTPPGGTLSEIQNYIIQIECLQGSITWERIESQFRVRYRLLEMV